MRLPNVSIKASEKLLFFAKVEKKETSCKFIKVQKQNYHDIRQWYGVADCEGALLRRNP